MNRHVACYVMSALCVTACAAQSEVAHQDNQSASQSSLRKIEISSEDSWVRNALPALRAGLRCMDHMYFPYFAAKIKKLGVREHFVS